jgi:hypothetical protein
LQKSTNDRLFAKDGLADTHKDIPTTIKDAMTLCSSLGCGFLWVDALCIYQDNRKDQANQMKNMHVIYQNAAFTLVPASGPDSWAGLPGVSLRTHKQIVETVHGMKLANVLLDYDAVIVESTWSGRAWTMQEAHFSSRAIYITAHQTYFQCPQAIWREDRIIEADLIAKVDALDSRVPLNDYKGNTYLRSRDLQNTPLSLSRSTARW